MYKKIFSFILTFCLMALMFPASFAAAAETKIVLSNETVTVDGAAISQDTSSAVYLSK